MDEKEMLNKITELRQDNRILEERVEKLEEMVSDLKTYCNNLDDDQSYLNRSIEDHFHSIQSISKDIVLHDELFEKIKNKIKVLKKLGNFNINRSVE